MYSIVASWDRSLVLAAVGAIGVLASVGATTSLPVCDHERPPPPQSSYRGEAPPQAMLMEPPGGPLIWGLTARPANQVALDGGVRHVSHGHGQGALLGFQLDSCRDPELEVARRAPAPATIVRRRDPASGTVYVPDGVYDLTVICSGQRDATTRLHVRRS